MSDWRDGLIDAAMPLLHGHPDGACVIVLHIRGSARVVPGVNYFGRDEALNAINAKAATKPPYNLLRTGGTVGGPVPKIAATRFFGSFEYLRINTATVEALPASNPYAPYENGNYPFTQWERLGDVKVDHTFTTGHNIYGRYAYDTRSSQTGALRRLQRPLSIRASRIVLFSKITILSRRTY